MSTAPAKKPALGGITRLSDMAKMALAKPEPAAVADIAIGLIFVKKQVRRNLGNIDGLVSSFKDQGKITTRLWVHEEADGRYRLIAGHRRLHAAPIAGYDKVPVEIYRGLTELQIRGLQVSENNDRENLSLYDQAMGVIEDIELYGMEEARRIWNQDPKKTGKELQSEGWMSKRVAVTRYAEPVLELMHQGITEDFEILHSLNQLYDLDRAEFDAMVGKAKVGEFLSREGVRYKVAAVQEWIEQRERATKPTLVSASERVDSPLSAATHEDGHEETEATPPGKAPEEASGVSDASAKPAAKPEPAARQRAPAHSPSAAPADRAAKDLAKARSAVIGTGSSIGKVFDQMMVDLNKLRIADPEMKLSQGEWILWQSFAAVVGPVAAKLGKKRTQQYLTRLAKEMKGEDASASMTALLDTLGVDQESPGEMPAGWTF